MLLVDISRKEARAELRKINHQLSSNLEPVPQVTKDSLEKLMGKVQELGVLCNRSLFITDNLNSRLETQQDCLLQQEAEQLATSEAILAIWQEIAI